MGKLKTITQERGSNPLLRQQAERAEHLKKYGPCDLRWSVSQPTVDYMATDVVQSEAHVHRCHLFKGHMSRHECHCGATRTTPDRKTPREPSL